MTTDTSIFGMGGSVYGREKYEGPIPFERVRDLFNFTVEHRPLYTQNKREGWPSFEMVEVPGRHALVRTDTDDVLNVTSKRYGIHQFSEVLLDNLLTLTDAGEGDLQISGAGLLRNGAVGWVQVQAPMMRVASDDLAPTLTLASSHDGSMSTSYRAGLFRLVCSNQLGVLKRRAGNGHGVYRLKHTLYSKVRFAEAREVMKLMWDTADEVTQEAARMIDTTVTDAQWERILKRLHPRPEQDAAPASITRWENRRGDLRGLWTDDERVAPYRNTAWGVLQMFNTYNHWKRPTRAGDAGAMTRSGYVMQDYLSGRMGSSDQQVREAIRLEVGV